MSPISVLGGFQYRRCARWTRPTSPRDHQRQPDRRPARHLALAHVRADSARRASRHPHRAAPSTGAAPWRAGAGRLRFSAFAQALKARLTGVRIGSGSGRGKLPEATARRPAGGGAAAARCSTDLIDGRVILGFLIEAQDEGQPVQGQSERAGFAASMHTGTRVAGSQLSGCIIGRVALVGDLRERRLALRLGVVCFQAGGAGSNPVGGTKPPLTRKNGEDEPAVVVAHRS